MHLYPLYASLDQEAQARALAPLADTGPRARKIIVATNVAETSLTIEGVVYVIDAGLAKKNRYDPGSGGDALRTSTISRAAAAQRAGRAGRTQAGVCFRLYTEEHFLSMPVLELPEIMRTDFTDTALTMLALGIDDLVHFDFLSPP